MSDEVIPDPPLPEPPNPWADGLHVYWAISEVMRRLTISGIAKNKRNEMQKYNFRGIDDVYNALAPILASERLLILPRMTAHVATEKGTKSGGSQEFVNLTAEYDFVSAIDGSKHTCVIYGEGMDSADKATNKAMSAAYKYLCFQAFAIPIEGLDDGDADAKIDRNKRKLRDKNSGPSDTGQRDDGDLPTAREEAVGELNLTAGMKKILDKKLAEKNLTLAQLIKGYGVPSSSNINDAFDWIGAQ